MNELIKKVREMDTEIIIEAIFLIGGEHVSEDKRMARAALIEVYEEREGTEDADFLMDVLGL